MKATTGEKRISLGKKEATLVGPHRTNAKRRLNGTSKEKRDFEANEGVGDQKRRQAKRKKIKRGKQLKQRKRNTKRGAFSRGL